MPVEKRKHATAFHIGPANAPDSQRKRKADRVKQALIDRAKIKQDFARVKKRKLQEEEADNDEENAVPRPSVYELAEQQRERDGQVEDDVEGEGEGEGEEEAATKEAHPDRQALIDGTAENLGHEENVDRSDERGRRQQRQRKPRQDPFAKARVKAEKQRAEAERRRVEREEQDRQRRERMKDRERLQRMARKARRPGVDGKRKLGRESGFLLEKVRRLVGDGKA